MTHKDINPNTWSPIDEQNADISFVELIAAFNELVVIVNALVNATNGVDETADLNPQNRVSK
jgi:hypothetical protein